MRNVIKERKKILQQLLKPETMEKIKTNDYHTLIIALLGHICNKCGIPRNLEIHHKNGDYEVNNLQNIELLCHNCHKLIHQVYKENRESICPRCKKLGIKYVIHPKDRFGNRYNYVVFHHRENGNLETHAIGKIE